MKLFRFFLTEATEAVTEGAEATGSPRGGMVDMMDLLLVVMLLGFGVVALYNVIRLHREQMLFASKILYPGDCKPEDCADPGGFIDYIVPRLTILSIAFILMGVGAILLLYVFPLNIAWMELASVILPVGGLIWYVICQRKAAKLFW